MTAEQQQAMRSASSSARKAVLPEEEPTRKEAGSASRKASKKGTRSTGTAKGAQQKARTGRRATTSKRTAKGENFEAPARPRGARHQQPRAELALGMPVKIGIAVLALVIAIIVILYPPAQTYYQTMRHEQRLQAQYDAASAYNAEVAQSNEELNTSEGIENKARRDYGWVKDGEVPVVITNPGYGEADTSSDIPEQMDPEDVHAPQTWYYAVLDAIFFVHE